MRHGIIFRSRTGLRSPKSLAPPRPRPFREAPSVHGNLLRPRAGTDRAGRQWPAVAGV